VTLVRGSRVVLRAFRSEEIDVAMSRMATIPPTGPEEKERNEKVRRERRQRLERSGSRNDWEVLFAIEADGRVVGDVQGRCPIYSMPPGVWELGIEIWGTSDRGRGLGREAVALMTTHLFDEEGAIRVQATTDVDNAPMRGVLEILGFRDEGVLRGYMPAPPGPPKDYTMYAMTRTDWEEVRARWTPTS
jgi:RimJ/RimL family protein N-acetyltransferase